MLLTTAQNNFALVFIICNLPSLFAAPAAAAAAAAPAAAVGRRCVAVCLHAVSNETQNQ